jgi:hypothetical protein
MGRQEASPAFVGWHSFVTDLFSFWLELQMSWLAMFAPRVRRRPEATHGGLASEGLERSMDTAIGERFIASAKAVMSGTGMQTPPPDGPEPKKALAMGAAAGS